MRDDYYDYDPITYELRNKNRDDVLKELNEIEIGPAIVQVIVITLISTLFGMLFAENANSLTLGWCIFCFIFSLLGSSLFIYLCPPRKGDM